MTAGLPWKFCRHFVSRIHEISYAMNCDCKTIALVAHKIFEAAAAAEARGPAKSMGDVAAIVVSS